MFGSLIFWDVNDLDIFFLTDEVLFLRSEKKGHKERDELSNRWYLWRWVLGIETDLFLALKEDL